MSSFLTVVLREQDGKTHVHCRNSAINWYVNNVKFVEKSPEHTEFYVSERQMKWESAHPTELAPLGQGLVVLDQKTNRILDYTPQLTCHLGVIPAFMVDVEMKEDVGGGLTLIQIGGRPKPKQGRSAFTSDKDSYAGRLKCFNDRGKLKGFAEFDKDKQEYCKDPHDNEGVTLEQLARIAKDGAVLGLGFVLDMSPYEIINYDSIKHDEQVRQFLREMGLEPDKDEWQKWLNGGDR